MFSGDNPRLDLGVAKYNDDPANQTDPAKLQQSPCTGSKLPPSADDTFGPPTTTAPAGNGETAAGH